MNLSIQMLTSVANVNNFDYATEVKMTKGNAKTIYFRLVDSEQHEDNTPAGLRYIPAAGATVSVDFLSLNDANEVTRLASNPFSEDTSIWSVPILSTDPIEGTVNLKITLTEGAVVTTIFAQAAILVGAGIGGLC